MLTLTEPARTLWRTIRGELARLRREYELRPESCLGQSASNVFTERIERDARETLRAISADESLVVAPEVLVDAAIRGIETSRYERLEIEPAKPGQPARVVTTTKGRKPRAIAVPRTRIAEVLEETGLNHCLKARYVDVDSFMQRLHIEREQPARPRGTDGTETP